MKKLMIVAVFAAVLAIPAYSFAATYGYITTTGTFATVTANTADEALRLPKDIHANSGVILLNGGMMLGTSTAMTATSTMSVGTSTTATTTASTTLSK